MKISIIDYTAEKIDVNGFAVLDILDGKAAAELSVKCDGLFQAGDNDFLSSSHFLDPSDSQELNHNLHHAVRSSTERILPGLDLLGGTLATKLPGKANLVAHMDWTVVDEQKFNSYNLWLALVDTNKTNGTLGLIPGSHRWSDRIRGLDISNPYARFTSKLLRFGIEPELKAGQAILYNHQLLHYSRPNRSDRPRNVAIIGMNDKGANLLVSFRKHESVLTYSVSEADFYGFDAESVMRNNVKLDEAPYRDEQITWKKIEELYRKYLPEHLLDFAPKRRSALAELFHKFRS